MLDPQQLYTLDESVVAKLKEHHPVLIHQLDGFVDAGQAGRLFSAHLLEHLQHEVLAEFDHDQLHDYRSRRPAMVFDTNQWKSYADLHLRLYRVTDEQGEVFLLLSGPGTRRPVGAGGRRPPRADREVRCSADSERARHSDGGAAHPADHPHRARHRHRTGSGLPQLDRPGRGAGQLHRAAGVPARPTGPQGNGFRRACPALSGPGSFPEAALTLTRSLNQATGLAVPLEPLEKASAANMADIAEEMQGSSEVQELVATLEQQYDSLQANNLSGCPAPMRSPRSSRVPR